jgi:hypothetical protein
MWLIRTKATGGANANIILQRIKVSTTASGTTALFLNSYYQGVEISKGQGPIKLILCVV